MNENILDHRLELKMQKIRSIIVSASDKIASLLILLIKVLGLVDINTYEVQHRRDLVDLTR